jgi:hypothetical protein
MRLIPSPLFADKLPYRRGFVLSSPHRESALTISLLATGTSVAGRPDPRHLPVFWVIGREIVSFTDGIRILDYYVTSLGSESVCSFGLWGHVRLHRPNPRVGMLPIQSFLVTFNSNQQCDLSSPLFTVLSYLFQDYRDQEAQCCP